MVNDSVPQNLIKFRLELISRSQLVYELFDSFCFGLTIEFRLLKLIISVECEVGVVGGSEGGDYEHKIKHTNPFDAWRFSKESGADAMAVAIGNAHGVYASEPELRFDILKQIHQKSELPFVLHGGSGITDEDFQEAIRCGIRKVNIATASFMNTLAHVQDYLSVEEKLSYFGMSDAMVEGTYENVKRHIEVFLLK